jgi:hypothetical protein
MGVDIITSIKVYVKCKSSLKKEKFEFIGCNTNKCEQNGIEITGAGNNNYCSSCGNKLGSITKYIEVSDVDTSEVVDEKYMVSAFGIDDDNCDYYVSNVEKKCPLDEIVIDAKYSDPFACEIDYKKIPEQIEWFKKTFSKEIKKLEKAYGPKNVEICFGVIHEVS